MSDPEFEWIDGDRPQLMLRGDWAVATIGGIDGQHNHAATGTSQ